MKNKLGIYFAFWERNWNADYCAYIRKVQKLGFDTLEIGAASLPDMSQAQRQRISETARAAQIDLTYCIGLPEKYNIASSDAQIRTGGVRYMKQLLTCIASMGGDMLGGIVYGCWPGAADSYETKMKMREQSLISMKEIAEIAADLGITLCLEVVNRFEQFIMNTAEEAIAYVEELSLACRKTGSVKLLLDTFHMNIEEDSLCEAIKKTGDKGLIGHFHIGECNRKVPGPGGRMAWEDMIRTLSECGYENRIVMEPFIKTGGAVGHDIRIYRDLSGGCGTEMMDRMAAESCAYIKTILQKY